MTNPSSKSDAIIFDQKRAEFKKKLNPQEYPGNISMIFELDLRVCVVTDSNQTYVGELSSFDEYGSVVLTKAFLRIINGNNVENISFGCIMLRAENIAMIGQIDKQKEIELGYCLPQEEE